MIKKCFLLFIFICILISCTSYSKKGFKRLDVYSDVYDSTTEICVEFYKNKMITEEEKRELKSLSMLAWATYNIAVNSLKVYQSTKSEIDKEIFTLRMQQYTYRFKKFMDYSSKLLKKYNIKNVNLGNWKYKQFEGFTDSNTLKQALSN